MTNEKPTEKWNVRDFQKYLADQHELVYGIKYVTNSYGFEGRKIKEMLAEHGSESLKRFIDTCYREYRPTAQWPTVNFAGMYSFMRMKTLPKVLMAQKAERLFNEIESEDTPVEKTESSENINELKGWF